MADNLLSKIYSSNDALKRRVKDFGSNPLAYTQQVADYLKGELQQPEKVVQMATDNMNPVPGLSGGALGMLIGMRGAQRLPDTLIHEKLGHELKSALAAKKAGEEFRLRSNSGLPLTHTSYEGRPFFEIDDAGLIPRRHQEFDKDIPFLDTHIVPERFQKAYGDELGEYSLLNSTTEPLGSGSFDPTNKRIMLGHGPTSSPAFDELARRRPDVRAAKLKETLAHELGGHFMSKVENVTPGTSPEYLLPIMRDTTAYQQLERNLLRSGFLKDLGNGSRPDDLYQLYSKEVNDKGALRQFQRYVQALKEGRMTPAEALDQGMFFQNTSKNLVDRVDNQQTLNRLLDQGFMDQLPAHVRNSAESYGARNATSGVKPEELAQAYGLYRANAGENMAETIGSRSNLTPQQRRMSPFHEDMDIPLGLVHTVR